MGLLKKLTKPLSKFLDKIIPNEIKPALPYLSAFAPFMLPAGIAGGTGLGAILRRAALTGGLNIGSQLAQEGSEGEFSGLSALMAAGTGAMTAPGATDYFGVQRQLAGETPGILSKAKQFGYSGLEKGSKFFEPATDMFGATEGALAPGFDKATLKAISVPVSHGTADLSMAVARKADRDYQRQMAEDESQSLIDDEGRRRAIRAAMEAGGHGEEAILDALASLGLIEEDKAGGIVGLKHGGRIGFQSGGKYDSRATPGEFRKALENVSAGSTTQQEKDLQRFTQNFLTQGKRRQGNVGGLGGLHLQDRGGYTLTGGPDAKPNFSNIYAGYLGKGLNKDQIRGQAIADTFSLSGPYSDPMLTPGTASPYSWESMVQNKAQSDYIAKLLGAKDGGRIGMVSGGGLKAAWAAAKGIKNQVVKSLSRMTDDIEMQGTTDFATDTGADFALSVKAKTKKGKKVLDGLVEEGIVELDDGMYYISDMNLDEATMGMGEGKLKASGMLEEGSGKFTRFDEGIGEGPYGGSYYGYDRVIENLKPKKADGGMMSVLPRGTEADYRGGGVIPMGSKERADDVPARLSKNEFVMTADAVKAAGGGSVNRGAKKMYNLMHNLEARV